MKTLYDILESLLDAEDDDQFTPEQVHRMNIWNGLLGNKQEWIEAAIVMFEDMKRKGLKKLKAPSFKYWGTKRGRTERDKFEASLKDNEYYMFVKERQDKPVFIAICRGIEMMYTWSLPKNLTDKCKVTRMLSMNPKNVAIHEGPKETDSFYILPKDYIWLYDKIVEEYNKTH